MLVLNALLLSVAIGFNFYDQVFCNPTYWTIPVIAICFTNSIFLPISIQNKKLSPLVSFINGISLSLFIYCIVFFDFLNYISFFFMLLPGILGVLFYIPHFFVYQILKTEMINKRPIFFILGFLISLSIPISSKILYEKALVDIEEFKQSNYQKLQTTFMTEKILGIGIIYHTKYCPYDGWRPPQHEPLLNIGLWLSQNKKPLDISLEKRVELYKKFFPNKQLKYNCSCSFRYKNTYHNDDLWK